MATRWYFALTTVNSPARSTAGVLPQDVQRPALSLPLLQTQEGGAAAIPRFSAANMD